MKILFTGGGTAGSVMPLRALIEELKNIQPSAEVFFVGTRAGQPERVLVEPLGIRYRWVAAGKFRRYFDVRNMTDIFVTVFGFFQSLILMYRLKPDVIVGAGGYVQVPVMWAGWVFGARLLVHQQDIVPSLSNILMLNLARTITVTFEKSLQRFPSAKTKWTGNPVRREIIQADAKRGRDKFHLSADTPVLVIMGGGTGAAVLNGIVQQAVPALVERCQIVHCTGLGKSVAGIAHHRYQQHEFIGEYMADVLAAATLVISRAGLSSLSELCVLKKPSIVIPMPDSHQEVNAEYFRERSAALVIKQADLSPTKLVDTILSILGDQELREQLQRHIGAIMHANATTLITQEIINLTRS